MSRKARLILIGLAVLLATLLVVFWPIKGVSISSEGQLCIELNYAYASPDWVSPTGHDDPDSKWVWETNIYDDNTGSRGDTQYTGYYVELLISPAISCDKVRFWLEESIIGGIGISLDVYYSDDWHNIYAGFPPEDQWVEKEIGSTQTVSKARVKMTTGLVCYFYEFDFNEVAACSEDITNSPSSWSVNGGSPVAVSSTYTTGLTYFTVTNNSGGAVDIDIRATDMTGGGYTWTLSDTATPGDMTYGLKAGLSGGDYTIIVKKNSPFNNLVEDLPDSGEQDFGLKIYTPTSYDDGNAKQGTVTVTATCV